MVTEDPFLQKLRDYISEHKLLKSGNTLLVGFSGGPDSTALLHALMLLRLEYRLTIFAAHINYNLRGEDSIADMQFARELCSEYGIALVVKDVTVQTKANLENEARRIRFDFFQSLITLYKIDRIALGHNRDDVVETMLLHLFRGAGITGLKGILPTRENIIRPLLPCSREEIIAYLSRMKIKGWRLDRSNLENSYTRNRIRNSFIPWLVENVNPRAPEVLYENSLIFREADDYLRDVAARLLKKGIVSQSPGEISLDLNVISRGSRIILFYLFRAAIGILTGSETGFYHIHFSQICEIIPVEGSKMLKLPGDITVRKEYSRLILSNKARIEQGEARDKRDFLEIDTGKRFHVFGNRRIMTKRISYNEIKRSYYEDRYTAMLDLEKVSLPVTVGYRKKGDRFVPMGMKGTKKLKDFFIDEKFSKFERDTVLIFRDREKIIWVSGLRIDDRVKLNEETQSVLLLKVEKIRVRSRKQVLRKKR